MKYCPSCQTNYADDTLTFCLQDGTELKRASDSQMPTVILGELETLISSKQSKKQPLKLSVKDLSVTYIGRDGEKTEAVRDVSFDVHDKPDCGEIIVFLGPSGCGKSTILKSIAGLIPPTKGEISVDDKPVTEVGRDRGMVFQAYTSFAWLTVRQNVEYGLKLQGIDKVKRKELSSKILEDVGLHEFAGRYPKDLDRKSVL